MKLVYLTTTSFFLLALTRAAPASSYIADLDFVCEMLLDQCSTAIVEALGSLPAGVTAAPITTTASSPTTTPTMTTAPTTTTASTTTTAPASGTVVDLYLACEILVDQCPTVIVEAFERLRDVNPSINTSASVIERSALVTPKI